MKESGKESHSTAHEELSEKIKDQGGKEEKYDKDVRKDQRGLGNYGVVKKYQQGYQGRER